MGGGVDQVLVSVVMIFWNAERFFDEAIQSVLTQTHPSVELLLCDDGSGETSTAIARQWAAAHPDRIRYLEHAGHAHRGMSSTRNLGIAAARGEFVAFLDADDAWEPEHLRHDVALLAAHPEAALVCGQASYWASWEDPAAEDIQYPLPWPPGVVVPPPQMLTALLRRGNFRTPTCSLLVRKQALDAVGGAEDEFTGQYEDQALLAKLYLAYPCVISGTRTARYRRHTGSSTARAMRDGTNSDDRPNVSQEAFLRWLSGLPQVRQGAQTGEIRALLDQALQPYDRPLPRAQWRAKSAIRNAIPPELRPLVHRAAHHARALGLARVGYLRRTTPLSRQFGSDRGQPIDRYYVERFLSENAQAISGRVLEVGDASYTRRFGGARVTQADVLNIQPGHPDTTIVADLADADHIPSDTFDCLVITQTLHLVYDLNAAVRTLHRILKPGGTLLATFPGISPLSSDQWADTWYWSLTPLAATRLFAGPFGTHHIEVTSHGNVLTTVAFCQGMATHELRPTDLNTPDPQFPMLITVRALRPAALG
jgi:SAM-dependent methyltransferase